MLLKVSYLNLVLHFSPILPYVYVMLLTES